MLKIEKDSTLTIHKKDQFWTKTLAIALLFAILIHAMGLLLFKIRPISCHQCQTIFPPISVQMEAPIMTQQDIVASAQDDPLPRSQFLQKPKRLPAIPVIASHTLPPPVTFGFCEHKLPFNLPKVTKKHKPIVQVRLLGGLANRKVLSSELELNASQVFQTSHYTVTVDDRSGKILWIDPLDDVSRVLSHLHFNKKENGSISKGELEVQFQ